MALAAGAGFVLVHVATPLEVCEQRDRKGLYARARAGLLTGMTGIDDPYEEPTDADLVVDTTDLSVAEAVQAVLHQLTETGWVELKIAVRLSRRTHPFPSTAAWHALVFIFVGTRSTA